jgi:hypothetical protein
LLVGPDGHFQAIDTHTQCHQSLSELSDGTRVHLLLAARLSFIEHIEKDRFRIPLFLDEVLSTTDPDRFVAVAGALFEFAVDGRQVFYATADFAEAQALREQARAQGFADPQVITLDDCPTVDQWQPAPKLPSASGDLPAPGDLDAIGYSAALQLTRPRLHDPVGAWPLPLVLHNQLDAAHRAAEAGVRHLGQLDLVDKGVELPLDDEVLAIARARGRAIGATIEALRVGRGEPVSWEAVQASAAVSDAFTERAQKLLAGHQTDPKAFVEALSELPRFHTAKIQQLKEHLEDVGILDPREPLASGKVLEQAQLACRDDIEAGRLTLGEIEKLVEFVRDVVQLEPESSATWSGEANCPPE